MSDLPIYIRVRIPELGQQWATQETPYTECRLLDFRYDGGYGMKCRSQIIVQTPDGKVREMRELSEHPDDRPKLYQFLSEKQNAEYLYGATHFKGETLDEQMAKARLRKGRAHTVQYNNILIRVFPLNSCGVFRVYPSTPKRVKDLERISEGAGFIRRSLREYQFVDLDDYENDWEDFEEVFTGDGVAKAKTKTIVFSRRQLWR